MKISNRQNLVISLKVILFCSLVYFPIFLHLDKLPIRIWDEARLALSAFEMSENGNYLITFIKGESDFWSPKPPLMIWLQVFFIKLIGPGELAIRLPSAIAALLTTCLLMIFSIKYFKSYWFGLISVLVLVTTNGYINSHATRTGDYDSLLTFFTTAYLLCFFLFLEYRIKKYIHLFFISITLAILTKSIQGLIFLPGLFLYILIEKQLYVLKNKWLYIDLGILIFVIASYYLIREMYDPGYLKAVWMSELGGRYFNSLSQHSWGFFYYYDKLINNYYSTWFWLVPCGAAIGLFVKASKVRRMILFSSIVVFSYFLIISLAKTKLSWYVTPMFPFLAILVASILHFIFKYFFTFKRIDWQFKYNVLPLIFLFVIFLHPYQKIIEKVYFPKEDPWTGDILTFSYYLQDVMESGEKIENKNLAYDGYDIQLVFYTSILNDRGQDFEFVDWKSLHPGDTIMAYQHNIISYIESNYHYELIEEDDNIKTFSIKDRK